jgi:hypothetical protein
MERYRFEVIEEAKRHPRNLPHWRPEPDFPMASTAWIGTDDARFRPLHRPGLLRRADAHRESKGVARLPSRGRCIAGGSGAATIAAEVLVTARHCGMAGGAAGRGHSRNSDRVIA